MQLERYNMNHEAEKIPYIAYEGALARNERTIKRLIISLVLSVFLMFASNAIWLWAFSQYEYVDETTTTVQQDGKGQNVYGDNNNLNDGAKDSNNKTPKNGEEKR